MASRPPLSRRGKILQNLLKQLNTIKLDNGYSRNIYEATTNVKTWSQVPEANTPTVYVVDADDTRTYHAGKLTEVSWNVDLYGVMKNAEQVDMEEFISDIEVCLTKNVTLGFPETATPDNLAGRTIAQIRIKDIITDNQLFSEIESSQLFKITITLIYTKCFGER